MSEQTPKLLVSEYLKSNKSFLQEKENDLGINGLYKGEVKYWWNGIVIDLTEIEAVEIYEFEEEEYPCVILKSGSTYVLNDFFEDVVNTWNKAKHEMVDVIIFQQEQINDETETK